MLSDHEDKSSTTRHLAIASTALAGAAIVFLVTFVIFLVTKEKDPEEVIRFQNPAEVVREDGSIPSLPGYEGMPAVELPANPDEPVLPIRWVEINESEEPVSVTFDLTVSAFDRGVTNIPIALDADRQPFKPGTHVEVVKVPLLPEVYSETVRLAESGVCDVEWSHAGSALPFDDDIQEAPWWLWSYTVVVPEGVGAC